MELMMFFFMGVLFTLAVIGLAYLSILVRLPWHAWVTLITGAVLILFGIGWAGSSFLEGIAQSGAMALILFSGTGLLAMILTWRFQVKPSLGDRRV